MWARRTLSCLAGCGGEDETEAERRIGPEMGRERGVPSRPISAHLGPLPPVSAGLGLAGLAVRALAADAHRVHVD